MSEFLSNADLAGLPQELIDQLEISDSDRKDMLIFDLVKEHQPIHLNHLLIKIWRKTGVVEQKTKLMARCYRMSVKNLIKSVDGKKGVYVLGGAA